MFLQTFSTLTPLADVNFILMLHGVAAYLFIFSLFAYTKDTTLYYTIQIKSDLFLNYYIYTTMELMQTIQLPTFAANIECFGMRIYGRPDITIWFHIFIGAN